MKRAIYWFKTCKKSPNSTFFPFFFFFFCIFQFKKFLKKMSGKILYFITGDYEQIHKECISENRLFLSCLVFEVKHFFKPPPGGVLRGWGVNGGVRQKFPLNKNLCIWLRCNYMETFKFLSSIIIFFPKNRESPLKHSQATTSISFSSLI